MSSTKTSAVWKHFKIVKVGDVKKAQCQICDKKLAYHSGTTNLNEHLKSVSITVTLAIAG